MPYGTLNADKVVNSDSITSGGLYGFKNRIINGAMVIDQRNAGAAVSLNNTSGFSCDRWQARIVGGGVASMQRSTVVPAGFTNSQSLTVTTADASIASTDDYKVGQFIEGFNIADLGWGAAGAQAVTLSFWVRSSITGTYAVALQNSAENRSYPATYTISAANTWEQKTITIAGDTSGTWLTDNGIGIRVNWNLGSGSSFNGTANAWNAADARTVSGAVSWIGTNGATFYITGVQLEKGSTATSFDYRPYGTELMLCQRYFSMSYPQGTAPGTATTSGLVGAAVQFASGIGGSLASISYPVQMRSTPTISLWDGAGTSNKCSYTSAGNYTIVNNGTLHTTGATYISSTSFMLSPTSSAANSQAYVQYTSSAEL